MIILFDNQSQTLPVMIASVKSQFTSDFGAQYVGVVISTIPILIVFSIMSKKVISEIAAGAVKVTAARSLKGGMPWPRPACRFFMKSFRMGLIEVCLETNEMYRGDCFEKEQVNRHRCPPFC